MGEEPDKKINLIAEILDVSILVKTGIRSGVEFIKPAFFLARNLNVFVAHFGIMVTHFGVFNAKFVL